MAELKINIKRGGLGRQSANTDTWAGLFVEVDALPGGWTANEVKRIFRPEDLEEYGISEDSANDNYKLAYWHASEVFRLAPDSTIYMQLGVPAADGTLPAAIMTAFNQAEDKLRLFGVVLSTTEIGTAPVEALQAALISIFNDNIQPARAIVSYKKAVADAIPDFSADANYRVMVDIANDLTVGGLAKAIFDSSIGMCGAAGTILGQLLRLSVHQKPSWRSFAVNGNGRWELLGDINGASVENKTQTEIKAYDTQGLNLIVRTIRLADAYISNARTAGDTADDYAIINHGRVIDKAIVLAYDSLVANLDGPIYADPNSGQIVPESTAKLTRNAYDAINTNMVLGRAGDQVELSVDPATGSLPLSAVFIDPSQNVLQTSTINVEIRLTPVGSSDTIVINIGLVLPETN